MKTINSFKKEYAFLSNYYISKNGFCAESYFQACKFENTEDKVKVSQMKPNDSKEFAHKSENKSKLRKDWNKISLLVMENALRIKFLNEPERTMLKNTGDAELIEGNTWHDNFYGSCTCEKCTNEKKENHLGKLLMKIRREISQ